MFRAFLREIGRKRFKCAGTCTEVAAQTEQSALQTFSFQYAPPRKGITSWRAPDTKSIDNVNSTIHIYKAIINTLGKNFLLNNYHVGQCIHPGQISWDMGIKLLAQLKITRNSFPSSSLSLCFPVWQFLLFKNMLHIFFKQESQHKYDFV